jgi:hypothetical protein
MTSLNEKAVGPQATTSASYVKNIDQQHIEFINGSNNSTITKKSHGGVEVWLAMTVGFFDLSVCLLPVD